MNISQAKEQIKNAMTAYFAKNEFGEYIIPEEEQRPVFLTGPPGIGKTAIMAQIAQELGVGLVSYSMTHHTRQSALGLPFIEKKNFGGKTYSVSEYTMSEIIASIYELMEETNVQEGILFIDEINCVSETLAPSMLQFLQYKIFGKHKVPHGWIVVTAGNPPEYNNSVREFDIVTWDRLKVIEVEPDYDIWKAYAYHKGVHPSITTYLEIKKTDFYQIETTVDGKRYVTARGWTDLSNMIRVLELKQIKVNEALVSQYLRHPKIAKEFTIYYDLFNKYRSDYQVPEILSGKAADMIKKRAKAARFDERLSLIGLLLDAVGTDFRQVYQEEQALREYMQILKRIKPVIQKETCSQHLSKEADELMKRLHRDKAASGISEDNRYALHRAHQMLEVLQAKLAAKQEESLNILTDDFSAQKKTLWNHVNTASQKLEHLFGFMEEIYGDGQEMVTLVAELTLNTYSAQFISRYGSKKYLAHNKELLFYERQKSLVSEILRLDLD